MTLSSIMGDTFAAIRACLWVLFPIAFAGTAALEIFNATIGMSLFGPASVPQTPEETVELMFSAQVLVAQIPVLVIGTYVNLLVVRIVWAHLNGEPLLVGDWVRDMVPLILPGVMVTICAVILVILGAALFLIPAFFIAALLMVILPVIVIERVMGPVSVLLRSRELTQDHLFLLFGLILLLLLAAFGFLTIVVPVLVLADSLYIGVLASAAIGSLLTIFSAALPTVIYAQILRSR